VHAWVEAGKIRVRMPGAKKEIIFQPPTLPGQHNLENAMAAVLLAMSQGLKPSSIQAALKAFKGVEHRIEEAGTFQGLRCIDDSKATNVDSTLVALRALGGPTDRILLILGGLHKGSPYTPLRSAVSQGVKAILTIGSAARKIEEDLGDVKPIFPCSDLKTAVETAFKIAEPGNILLLSPACASFDQFQNFEERGRRFKELVRESSR
jgi:UDP-N-acetylmuramoylalanine--D-glutamate ligase